MEEITIYKFQLDTIIEALRITSNIHSSSEGKTCHDRQVRQAYQYAKNAFEGKKDIEVPYMKHCANLPVIGRSELLPLDFIKWYSGMEEEKIIKAYERWIKESGNSL